MAITIGLYYNGARYLAAWLGRWTSADPIGIGADGPGLYNYTRGSPIGYTDPSGMAPENVWDKRAATQTAEQQDANVASAGEAAETMGYAALEFWNRRVGEAEWLGNALRDAGLSTEVGLASNWNAPPPEPISLNAIKVDDIPEEAKTVADVYEVGTALVGGAGLVKGGIKLGAKALGLIFKEASATRKVAKGSAKVVATSEDIVRSTDVAEAAGPAGSTAGGVNTGAYRAPGALGPSAPARPPIFADTDLLIAAQKGNPAAVAELGAGKTYVAPNQFREFTDVAEGARQRAFLEAAGVEVYGGPRAGAVARTSEFQEVFQKIEPIQGRGDAALGAFAKATGYEAVSLERRLTNLFNKTFPRLGVPIRRLK